MPKNLRGITESVRFDKQLNEHQMKLTNAERTEITNMINVMDTKKAGPQYKNALIALITIASEKAGHQVTSKKQALQVLDFSEPTIN